MHFEICHSCCEIVKIRNQNKTWQPQKQSEFQWLFSTTCAQFLVQRFIGLQVHVEYISCR